MFSRFGNGWGGGFGGWGTGSTMSAPSYASSGYAPSGGGWGRWGRWGNMFNGFGGYGPYSANSMYGSAIHILFLYIMVRFLWSWTTASGFPVYYWSRGIFVISFAARWLVEMALPMSSYDVGGILHMYLYHARWISWLSGGACAFTTVHALAQWAASVFCAVCGGTIKGVLVGTLDAGAFAMMMQAYYDFMRIDWGFRQMMQSTVAMALSAIFVCGVSFYHVGRGSMFSSITMLISGTTAVFTIATWLNQVHLQAYGPMAGEVGPMGSRMGMGMGGSMMSEPMGPGYMGSGSVAGAPVGPGSIGPGSVAGDLMPGAAGAAAGYGMGRNGRGMGFFSRLRNRMFYPGYQTHRDPAMGPPGVMDNMSVGMPSVSQSFRRRGLDMDYGAMPPPDTMSSYGGSIGPGMGMGMEMPPGPGSMVDGPPGAGPGSFFGRGGSIFGGGPGSVLGGQGPGSFFGGEGPGMFSGRGYGMRGPPTPPPAGHGYY